MDFIRYNGKLLDIITLLKRMEELVKDECNRYINCVKDMHEIGDPRRIELLAAAEKETKEKISHLEEMITFISELRDQVIYKQIYKELSSNNSTIDNKEINNDEQISKVESWSKKEIYANQIKNSKQKTEYNTNSLIQPINKENTKEIRKDNNIFYDKFMNKLINNNNLGHRSLIISREWSKQLSKYNISKWKEFNEANNITLEETDNPPAYYAYVISSKPSYYFLTPADGIAISEYLAVQNAYLAFFDFPNDELGNNGKKPILVKPALVKLEDGVYKFVNKGILKF